jgi:hypothetical protein
MKILQRNLNRGTFVVWEMKRNVSVVCVCSAPNCCGTEQRFSLVPGSVASGTPCIIIVSFTAYYSSIATIKHYESADDKVCYNQNTQKFVNMWATQARMRIQAPSKTEFNELQSD